MRVLRHQPQINVRRQFHIPCLNLQDLQTAFIIRHPNVQLTVKAPKAAQGGVDLVGSVGGGHDDDVTAGLDAIEEGEHLRDDAPFDFAAGFVAFGGLCLFVCVCVWVCVCERVLDMEIRGRR